MKQKTTQALYSYWNAVRRDRLAPQRFEIEPARIPDLLPETFIVEREGAERYRFRLAGTRICEIFGRELRGTDLLDAWDSADHDRLLGLLHSVTERGAVAVVEVELASADGRTALVEIIVLPLIHSNNSIDRLLGAVAVAGDPDWLGHETPTARRLIAAETVWPEGRPHELVERQHHQAPFLPHIRSARIVRSDRRQFRVYDGGREP